MILLILKRFDFWAFNDFTPGERGYLAEKSGGGWWKVSLEASALKIEEVKKKVNLDNLNSPTLIHDRYFLLSDLEDKICIMLSIYHRILPKSYALGDLKLHVIQFDGSRTSVTTLIFSMLSIS